MTKKFCFLLLTITIFCSCDCFDNKMTSSEVLLQNKLNNFNWQEIDTYPKFRECDTIINNDLIMRCFEKHFITYVNNYLAKQHIKVNHSFNDTIQIKIEINKKGSITIKSIDLNPKIREYLSNIDSLLHKSVSNLPKIQPAKKHSQEVTTVFILPIILK